MESTILTFRDDTKLLKNLIQIIQNEEGKSFDEVAEELEIDEFTLMSDALEIVLHHLWIKYNIEIEYA